MNTLNASLYFVHSHTRSCFLTTTQPMIHDCGGVLRVRVPGSNTSVPRHGHVHKVHTPGIDLGDGHSLSTLEATRHLEEAAWPLTIPPLLAHAVHGRPCPSHTHTHTTCTMRCWSRYTHDGRVRGIHPVGARCRAPWQPWVSASCRQYLGVPPHCPT